MKKLVTFATVAAIMAMQQPGYVPLYLNYGSKSYDDIPHKHRKHKRGRPK